MTLSLIFSISCKISLMLEDFLLDRASADHTMASLAAKKLADLTGLKVEFDGRSGLISVIYELVIPLSPKDDWAAAYQRLTEHCKDVKNWNRVAADLPIAIFDLSNDVEFAGSQRVFNVKVVMGGRS